MIPEPDKIDYGPGRLRDWLNNLLAFVVATRPLPSETCEISESPQGTRIEPDPVPGLTAAVAALTHPFTVLQRVKPGTEDNPVYQYGVLYESSLYKSLLPVDKQPITGLLSEDQTTGWFDLVSGGYIWLGIVFDSEGEITFAGIDNSDEDEFNRDEPAWAGNNGYCESDGDAENPVHQTSRKLIAYTVAGPDGDPVVQQLMRSHQVLQDVAIDARYAQYPFDMAGGYPL